VIQSRSKKGDFQFYIWENAFVVQEWLIDVEEVVGEIDLGMQDEIKWYSVSVA
jgi:hypothetical protein